MSEHKLLINGDLISTGEFLDVINPATGEVFIQVPLANAATLERAVAGAKSASLIWADTSFQERRELLNKIADRIAENVEQIAAQLTLEQGKPLAAAIMEVQFAEGFCRHFAGQEIHSEILQDSDEKRIEIHRKPLGVVAAIAPWNFPFLIAVYKLAPALITGNSIVIKPAPTTPLTAIILGELIADLVPAGLVNILVDNNDLGPMLSAHPDVAKVSFTGSTPTGKAIMANAAGTLKRLTLELGGNDAAIVLDDVNPAAAAPGIFGAAFINSGQVCIALKRLYVHDSIYDEMCDELAKLANTAVVGNGMEEGSEFGPVQNHAQYQKVLSYVDDAKANGTIIAGGVAIDSPGYFVPLTIVRDIEDGHRVVDEEPFGPVLPIIRYSDVDEVLSRANRSELGLGASVWSSNPERAHKMAMKMEAGTVWINQHCAFGPDIPFPPAKESGIGVEWGREGLLEFTAMQVINVNKHYAEPEH